MGILPCISIHEFNVQYKKIDTNKPIQKQMDPYLATVATNFFRRSLPNSDGLSQTLDPLVSPPIFLISASTPLMVSVEAAYANGGCGRQHHKETCQKIHGCSKWFYERHRDKTKLNTNQIIPSAVPPNPIANTRSMFVVPFIKKIFFWSVRLASSASITASHGLLNVENAAKPIKQTSNKTNRINMYMRGYSNPGIVPIFCL